VVLGRRAASKGGRPPMRCSEGANRNAVQASLVWTCHNLLSRISFLPAAAEARERRKNANSSFCCAFYRVSPSPEISIRL
jgi:hypothetical protein